MNKLSSQQRELRDYKKDLDIELKKELAQAAKPKNKKEHSLNSIEIDSEEADDEEDESFATGSTETNNEETDTEGGEAVIEEGENDKILMQKLYAWHKLRLAFTQEAQKIEGARKQAEVQKVEGTENSLSPVTNNTILNISDSLGTAFKNAAFSEYRSFAPLWKLLSLIMPHRIHTDSQEKLEEIDKTVYPVLKLCV